MAVNYSDVRNNILWSLRLIVTLESPGHENVGYLYDSVEDIHFIALGQGNAEILGPAIRNTAEAAALRELGVAIDEIVRDLGPTMDSNPQKYVRDPRWPRVLEAARRALSLMTDGREPLGSCD